MQGSSVGLEGPFFVKNTQASYWVVPLGRVQDFSPRVPTFFKVLFSVLCGDSRSAHARFGELEEFLLQKYQFNNC